MTEPGPIVVVGSHVAGLVLEVDAIPREGETVLGHSFSEPEDGGKATNQAVAAARLGAPVRVVTMLGRDDRGARWRETLAAHGIDVSHLIIADGPTDVGFVMLPPSRIPAIVSAVDLVLDAAAVDSRSDAFTGASLVLCQLEAPQDCAVAAFRHAHANDAVTLLNPAPVQPLAGELVALTDVIVANEHEAAGLAGGEGDLAEVTSRLARLREGWTAIVTAGAGGCYVAAGDGPVEHLPAPAVEAVDTTGAGDAFIGALAARLRAGDPLRGAVDLAVQAAALSVTRPGTMPAFARADEIAIGEVAEA